MHFSRLDLRLYTSVWIIILFCDKATGTATSRVPSLLPDRYSEPSLAVNASIKLFQRIERLPGVVINAAKTANLSADTESTIPCGMAIPVKGSLQCLENYHQFARATPLVIPYNETQRCPEGYEVGMSCAGTGDSFANPVSTDIKVLTDGDYDVAWIHQIIPGETITITFTFPAPFKVYSMIMSVDTVPIETIISGSLGGTAPVHLKTLQLETCSDPEKCKKLSRFSDRVLTVLLSGTTPVLIDEIKLAFPGNTQWLEYAVDYLLIEEILFQFECACKSGNCTADVIDSIPESVLAQYSCTCPLGFGGFLCDECANSFYELDDTCTACQCGYGANSSQCDSKGVCECNTDLYDSTQGWDSKCQRPYITDMEPRMGPVKGGTRVTLTGGLLTQLDLPFCERLENVACGTVCPTRDAMAVCITKPGSSADSEVVFANTTTSLGEITRFNFLYSENFAVSQLSPKESFASGGRAITITGSNLQYATSIYLTYEVKCLLDDRRNSFLLNQTECLHIKNTDRAVCKSPSFCSVRNRCDQSGRVKDDAYCFNKNAVSEALAFTIHSVEVSVKVDINGQHIAVNGSDESLFTVVKDPAIFQWTQLSLEVSSDVRSFPIPGENLDSGADLHDYKVTVGGVNAPPLRFDNSTLITSWPDSKPLGNTTVTVGSISVSVGELRLGEAEDTAASIVPIVVPIVVCVVFLAIIIPVLVLVWRRRNRRALERNALKLAYKPGNVRYVNRKGELAFIPLGNVVSDTALVEQLKPFLIEKEKLSLSTQLGAGQFGKVFKGTVQLSDSRYMTVAAKTLKMDASITEETVCNFLKEATLMSNFNHHNVLSLIGVVYAEGNMPVVVLPYMHLGDVRALIQSTDEVLVLGDLLHFAMQVGRGMQYLSEKRFIHRDLAARNCMVDDDYVVKIADFGLSHDIYEDDYYRVDETSTKPLPVKWMAIESLNSGRFTTESDVWSYGVVMWELLTRGLTPYPLVSNYEIKSYLNGGERLTQPDYCPPIIYEMMQACWQTDPKSRPRFEEIADKLSDILEDANYENRSKTKDIKSDYYKQPTSLDEFGQLYVDIID